MGWGFAGIGSHRIEGFTVSPEGWSDTPKLSIIDLNCGNHEAQIALRHPDGGVLVLTVKAHLSSLTVIGPLPVVVKELEDSDEMMLSWRMGEAGT